VLGLGVLAFIIKSVVVGFLEGFRKKGPPHAWDAGLPRAAISFAGTSRHTALLQPFDRPVANPHPHQPQGRQAHRRRHAPHLAVAPSRITSSSHAVGTLCESAPAGCAATAGLVERRLRLARSAVVQLDAIAQALQLLRARLALHLHPVGLGQLVLGVGDPRLQATVVGQQQQAFAVAVQAPGRVDAGDVDEILERRAPFAVAELRQHVERLVEQDQARLGRRRLGLATWAGRPRRRAARGIAGWQGHGSSAERRLIEAAQFTRVQRVELGAQQVDRGDADLQVLADRALVEGVGRPGSLISLCSGLSDTHSKVPYGTRRR
jgi:hypothetical protein